MSFHHPDRLLKCMWCSGTGWDTPPRENRQACRQCAGDGEVPGTHAWAGWEDTLDFCARNHTCPLNQKAAA